MRLLAYVAGRIGLALLTMFAVSAVVFAALHWLPGGFERIVLGPMTTDEVRAELTARFGLDQPKWVQYLRWLGAVLQGNFGISMITQKPVAAELLRRAPATIELALMAIALSLAVGVPLGIAAALGRRGGAVQGATRLFGAMGAGTPDFVLGTMLVYVFSVWSLGLTVGDYVPFAADPLGNLRSLALPAATLSLHGIALILRTTRDSVLVVLGGGHITTAVARGEPPARLLRRQVMRNAALPVLTVATMYFSALMGGAVIVETLFSVPGVGQYTWNALNNRDYQVTQSAVLIFSGLLVTVNMLVDIAYAWLDPRIAARGRHR
jgi:peptide/nickel transport system permease protein